MLTIYATATLLHHRITDSVTCIGPSSVREKYLINFQERLLVIDKQFKQMILILVGEILNLDPVLGQLCQLEQTLFEFSSFFRVLLNLLILFLIHNFVFQSSLHYAFSNFFNTLHEQAF